MTDHVFTGWHKARASSAESNCVEVAVDAPNGLVGVRHSKDPAGPVLVFTDAEWSAFLTGTRAGEFDA